jgi:hypothetical protein
MYHRGRNEDPHLTKVALLPLQINPVSPLRISVTIPSAVFSHVIRLMPSLPFASSDSSFFIGKYFEDDGSLISGLLAMMLDATLPVITVTTLIPSGCSSRRKLSLKMFMAALDALYMPI